jgi:hypothetical protein
MTLPAGDYLAIPHGRNWVSWSVVRLNCCWSSPAQSFLASDLFETFDQEFFFSPRHVCIWEMGPPSRQSHITTDGHSVRVSSLIWGPRPDICYVKQLRCCRCGGPCLIGGWVCHFSRSYALNATTLRGIAAILQWPIFCLLLTRPHWGRP